MNPRIGTENPLKLASFIDHTLLKAEASSKKIRKLCKEAIKFQFKTVCVNPCWVKLAKRILKATPVKICAVVGFPLGANNTSVKLKEAREALKNGSAELDVVMNIGKFKSGDYSYVADEIRQIRKASKRKILKVIIETSFLTKKEIVKAAKLAAANGADFIKTSTGFGIYGAKVADIKLISGALSGNYAIKASGGIKTRKDALRMINAGASRIGTSSSVNIIKDNN